MPFSWLRHLLLGKKAAKRQYQGRHTRLVLEVLEDRSLLSGVTYYWIGTAGGSWTNTSSWSLSQGGGVAGSFPQNAGDIAIFENTNTSQVITIPTGTTITVGEVDFNNGANSYTIAPVNQSTSLLAFNNSGSDAAIKVLAAGSDTISTNSPLSSNLDLTLSSSGSAFLSGAISGGFGLVTSAIGSGSVELSAANTYTGPTTINSGTLLLGAGSAIPSTSQVTLAAGGGANLDLNGFNLTVATFGTVSNSKTANTSTVLFHGGTLTTGGTNLSSIFSGVLNGASGTSITKQGTGTFYLFNAASAGHFFGSMVISGGYVIGAADGALGNASADGITVQPGASLAFAQNLNYSTAEAVSINGQGVLVSGSPAYNIGALVGNNDTFAGNITLQGDSRIQTVSASGTSVFKLTGTIALGGHQLTVGGHYANNVTVAGAVTDSGGGSITTLNAGTSLTVDGTLPVGDTLTVGSGTTLYGNGSAGKLVVLGAVQPGDPKINAFGTLTASSADFSGGGTLSVLITGTSSLPQSDRLALGSGALTLGGSATLSANMSGLTFSGSTINYTIVSTGTVNGTFTTTSYANQGSFSQAVNYTSTTVVVTIASSLAAKLVAAYNFDEGSGTTLHDMSGNGNSGVVSNASWSAAGRFGGALQFNGAPNSFVTVPDSASLHLTNGMTLEAWVEPSTLNSPDLNWCAAVSKENRVSSSNDVSYALYAAGGTNTPPTTQILVGGNDQGPQGGSQLTLNSWAFLAATYDGATLRIYVNGALVGSQSLAGTIGVTSDPFRIGGDWSGEMFTGLIDNVRIYNGALTAAQIQSDMTTPAGGHLTVSPATLASAKVNAAYTATLSASGGSGNYTFAVTAGSLPSWLSLNGSTGVLSGTPTSSGSSSFTITATDSNASSLTGSQAYTMTVDALTLSPPTLASATANSLYNAALSASGGSGSYTFAVTAGSLPSWLSLNGSTGALSGTPTSSGSSSFTITATDSNASNLTGSQAYTLTVNAASSLTVSPTTLANAVANSLYSVTLSATGGSGGYSFAVSAGTLPSWLSLNSSTGVLSGTPTTTGSSSFTIKATDSSNSNLTGSRAYTLTVNAASQLTVNPATLANASVNSAYSATLSATGGSGSYSFAVSAGTLPSWLSLNSSTGVLSGTPTTTGSSSFTIKATDSSNSNLTGSRAYTLTVTSSSGRTFYVATTGNDNNNGSAATPFATLQHAMIALQPGDTLNVEAGSYAGFIVGWDSTPASTGDQYGTIDGTASAPITIGADPNAAAGSVVINARNNETRVGIDLEPGDDYITISGFTINDSGGITSASGRGEGIKVTGNNDVVSNNTISNIVYGFGLFADNATNVVLRNNTITGTGNQGNANYGHGIYVSGSTNGAVVQGNVVHDNSYIGIHVNGDISEGGIGLVTNALIAGNMIYNNGQNGINCDGLQNSTIENNLIYGYQGFGIVLYQIDAGGGSKNNIIVNNTIVATVSGAGAAIRILNAGTGNTILNNILLGGGGIVLRISSDSMSGLVSNYNIGGGVYQSEDTGTTQTLAQWQTSTGQDGHSFTATAAQLFVNASANNYQLSSTSPAINAGTATDAPSTDILGNPRPSGGGFDIGAYQ